MSNAKTLASFTLIEIMVVVSIIAILLGMLFSAIVGAKEHFKRKQALTEAHNIVVALKTYRHEFQKWPSQIWSTNDAIYVTNNWEIIRQLLGENPRSSVFLHLQTKSLDHSTNYVDPWGDPYLICIDENMNFKLVINFEGDYSNEVSGRMRHFIITINVKGEVGAGSFGNTTNSFPINTWTE